MNFFLFVFNIAFLLNRSSCDLYTASAEIEKLLTTQKMLIDELQEYITVTKSKLRKLKMHLEIFKEENEKANENMEEYLSNPVNDYLLIKRLTLDWREMENLLSNNTSSALIKKITTNKSVTFPTYEDLQGAAEAIERLQTVYKIDASSLASGIINNKKYDINLSAKDCYQLAKLLYTAKNLPAAKLWMQEALIRYKHEIKKTVRKSKILKILATISHALKDYAKVPQVLDELSKILSNKEKIETNFTAMKDTLLQVKNNSRKGDDGMYGLFYGDFNVNITKTHKTYRELCRNEIGLEEDVKAKLKCRYKDLGNPFLKLAKLKEEDVFLDPKLLLYHDVIFDSEIKVIKELAIASMCRAGVYDDLTLLDEEASYRIGQVSFLDDYLHPKLAKLSQRVEDMTGLTTETAEPLQVVNYGIGGQYETHVDYLEYPEKDRYNPEHQYSERIATVLFYMNDVELGGATVFPCLKLSVSPKKGTALVWFNLMSSGAYEKRSKHASCPVLKGFKWISTKWLGEQGQALLQPCGLTEDAK